MQCAQLARRILPDQSKHQAGADTPGEIAGLREAGASLVGRKVSAREYLRISKYA